MKDVHKKVSAVAIGFLGTEVVNHIFDFVAYPLVIGFLGAVKGGIIMTLLAMGLNYGLIVAYHKTKYDWFGFEWLALKKTEEAQTLSGRVLRLFIKAGYWPAFVFLSWEDPFKAFIFVRGRKASGFRFDRTDWFWFTLTNLLGNLIWIILVSGVIEVVKGFF